MRGVISWFFVFGFWLFVFCFRMKTPMRGVINRLQLGYKSAASFSLFHPQHRIQHSWFLRVAFDFLARRQSSTLMKPK